MNLQKVYWWAAGRKDAGNFGDILNPIILKHFNINYEHIKSWKNTKIDLIAVGSIIDKATTDTVVLGSGIMSTITKINPRADFRLVRGPLTRDRIIQVGGHCPENYGDPGLLLPLLCDESTKKHDIGLIPHFLDYEKVCEKFPKEFVIDIMDNDPLNVAKKITSCRSIISSSLHGIIAAHSYGIPAAWASSDIITTKFSDTKFLDYFASINIDPTKSSFDDPIFTFAKDINIKNIVDAFVNYSLEI